MFSVVWTSLPELLVIGAAIVWGFSVLVMAAALLFRNVRDGRVYRPAMMVAALIVSPLLLSKAGYTTAWQELRRFARFAREVAQEAIFLLS